MVYTVTFNPAIDYIMKVDELTIGKTNRSYCEEVYVGGKGINVSRVLKEFEVDSVALGFCAGFTGDKIQTKLDELGINSNFIRLENGISRINIKIKGSTETEINGQGPEISKNNLEKLYEQLDELEDGDILVLAGSIPNTLPVTIYEDIISSLCDKNISFVVDATKDLLVNVLKFKPFLIKPNKQELQDIFNVTVNTEDEIIHYANKLRNMGAINVLVSMGKNGAILIDENGDVRRMSSICGKTVNSVGAGDSMVAGFIAGYLQSGDYEIALKWGTAAGTATAFSGDLATYEEIESVYKSL